MKFHRAVKSWHLVLQRHSSISTITKNPVSETSNNHVILKEKRCKTKQRMKTKANHH
jgi:hypothetical protein